MQFANRPHAKLSMPFAPEAYRAKMVQHAGERCVDRDCVIRTEESMLHPDIKLSIAAVHEFRQHALVRPNKALATFEGFKVWNSAIHAVCMALCLLPKETECGWPS
jgi:hypothetical protein